jgi:hypothetical protein
MRLAPHPVQAARLTFKVSDCAPLGRCTRVTFTHVGIQLFPWTSARLLVVEASHPATSAPFQVGHSPYPAGYEFPVPFGCRPWLLGRPIPAAGLARSYDGLLGYVPDRNGVPTFRIGKMRWASWPLYAGSGAPSQPGR